MVISSIYHGGGGCDERTGGLTWRWSQLDDNNRVGSSWPSCGIVASNRWNRHRMTFDGENEIVGRSDARNGGNDDDRA